MRAFVIAWVGWVLIACGSSRSSAPEQTPAKAPASEASATPDRVANLHAFARLYGVVRWFHPSDSAAAVDWNAFAIDGARRVIDAKDATALRDELRALFATIAPTVRVTGPGEALADAPELHPAQAAGLDVIAWEHLGYGDSAIVSIYASKRRHRPRTTPAPGEEFATVTRAVDAQPYRGAKIRLRGKVRVAPGARAELWLRVDRPNGMGFFDNMMDRPVRSTAWTDVEITGAVADDATQIAFGPLLDDDGPAWFEALALDVEKNGAWQAIDLPAWPKHELAGWSVEISDDGVVKVQRAMVTHDDELFADAPRAGETIDLELGRGLRARVPIALFSKDGHTLGDDPSKVAPPAPPTATGFDPIAGAADVIVAWNVLEHFWPYWDVVHVDWNAELDAALADALDDKSWDDHLATLERLSAAAPDGHANVQCAGAAAFGLLPLWIDQVEGKLIVIGSIDPQVKIGDELVAIDNRAAGDLLAERMTRVSGSPQWKQHIALLELGAGAPDKVATVRVKRDDKELELKVNRADHDFRPPPSRPAVDHLDGGIVYVDLARLDMKTIDLAALAKAPGVIFDMRGYPTGDAAQILSHVVASAEHTKWMATAHIVRPDHAAPPAWEPYGWDVTTEAPHLRGKIVFLTGPGAISYAESMMGYAEAEHVAIVGATSAGTNGNIAQIAEPTGCTTTFTGMRVTKHDGSTHHLVGVAPTIPASSTIAGIRAGKDEVLERALAAIKEK